MSTISIQYNDAKVSGNSAIYVTDGTFQIEEGVTFCFSGSLSFDALTLSPNSIDFDVPSGFTYNATVQIPLIPSSGTPSITVTNFDGSVTVSWPTNSSYPTESLTPGVALELNGFVS